MKLTFLGATGTVTGSRYHLVTDKTQLLIDCGLYQGIKKLRLRNWSPIPIKAEELDAVLLTHAHLDHSGYLPKFINSGFEGDVYCTAGTKALCDIILPDSGYLQQENALHANKHKYSKHQPAQPLYTQNDAIAAVKNFQTIPFHQMTTLNDIQFSFIPVGHIIGASMIQIQHRGITTIFSGDIGRPNDILMNAPEPIPEVHNLIIESTYGNRRHEEVDAFKVIEEIIIDTFRSQGVLLIPAFAVGRSQAILHIITELREQNRIPDIPIFLDSPMAIHATETYLKFQHEHRLTVEQCHRLSKYVQLTRTKEESMSLNEMEGSRIIVSASGMATGGRILHHIEHYAGDEKNTILFTGYQAPGTRGEIMVNGAKSIKLLGTSCAIKAKVINIDCLSAHSDYQEIINWLSALKKPPEKIFITHGDPAAADGLRFHLKDQLGWDSNIPEFNETIELS